MTPSRQTIWYRKWRAVNPPKPRLGRVYKDEDGNPVTTSIYAARHGVSHQTARHRLYSIHAVGKIAPHGRPTKTFKDENGEDTTILLYAEKHQISYQRARRALTKLEGKKK